MAATNAALKEGSLAIASPTKSAKRRLFSGVITVGDLEYKFSPSLCRLHPCNGKGNGWQWFSEVALWNCKELLDGRVKSSVIVGHDADGEKLAKPVETEPDNEGKRPKFGSVLPCAVVLVVEPERNMFNAADVVLAMDLAAGGSG